VSADEADGPGEAIVADEELSREAFGGAIDAELGGGGGADLNADDAAGSVEGESGVEEPGGERAVGLGGVRGGGDGRGGVEAAGGLLGEGGRTRSWPGAAGSGVSRAAGVGTSTAGAT